ncbi:MAG: carboxylating nicotinate-nucleotide diphosphorylase [Pseudomonadota bacterium]|nr:carboxylating nicotinate-nucleotide diphosphorylase [Gammaproteobacteria bacterium]MBU1558438.1 carboxylating nicotinate-nucleotide diphosphorylase [Gammaproteobacteria bacterium]MBU1628683.1 carboxylating nicotinate-nucleotide diphosphorylase [Gammaproteobacteria bacterium]MBU1927142.1 carboxylating nicotinate-nucleotide diphosphorylase [Gammaproteobacteria bacterium]MBU2546027.1 carboxylating nicotinate-nucleotide diphosphorylase [Gammaproteobacteria bacterium]
MQSFTLNSIDQALLGLALQEDLGIPYTDITTQTLFDQNNPPYSTKIISKEQQPVRVCGLPILYALCEKMELPFTFNALKKDGDILEPRETLLMLEGHPYLLLTLERTLLNFLRHLSAIATLTKQVTDRVKNTPLKILDTRKTTPGLRHLEKYAVHCGGGVNHRMGLFDAYMIKDTHIDLIGGLEKALERIPNKNQNDLPVIVEIRNLNELDVALRYGQEKIHRVLLDNMSINTMKQAVLRCENIFETEASGNITLENITAIAETGVQYASIGMLTYGAGQVDLSMVEG